METAVDSENPRERRACGPTVYFWQPKSFTGSETQDGLSKPDGGFNYREGPAIKPGRSFPTVLKSALCLGATLNLLLHFHCSSPNPIHVTPELPSSQEADAGLNCGSCQRATGA